MTTGCIGAGERPDLTFDASLRADRHKDGGFDYAVRGVDAAGAGAGGGALGDEFEMHYFAVSGIASSSHLA
jgi:hypothetical protein